MFRRWTCTAIVSMIAATSSVNANPIESSLNDRTFHIRGKWELRMCDRSGFCMRRSSNTNLHFYFLDGKAYYYAVHLLVGGGLGITVPISGGSGEYRHTNFDGVEKIGLENNGDRISVEYSSQTENMRSEAVFELRADAKSCVAQLKSSNSTGSYAKGIREKGTLKNVSCDLIKGRPIIRSAIR